MIDLRGFIETSLIDWDGKVVSVAFVGGCNFRCPFCHNALLVTHPLTIEPVLKEKIKAAMLARKDFIDGLVITGGEPCLYPDLADFIKEFKDLGFLIKLDTNGSNPEILKKLINQKAGTPAQVDYIAMDIKAPLDEAKYCRATGAKIDLEKIKQSVNLLLTQSAGAIDYEFRLTVVPDLINEADIEEIGRQLKGANKFVLQQFKAQNCLDPKFNTIKPYEKDVLRSFQLTLKQYIQNTILRGA
ncbi:MAG: anaerobic ribonucleoside-triphosphate reductase activating protein [Candidatus Margulisiibacteriota bacterium]